METAPEFSVVAWKDCHGVETLFMVVDKAGYRYGIYPSEHEAIAAAAEAAETASVAPAYESFTLTAPQ
jgi:hypothetical protein